MTDFELTRRVLRHSDDYLLIVKKYEALIIRFVQRLSQLSREDAEDIAQHVFLKAYHHLNDFDPKLKLSNWLLRIARNEVIDFWRKKKARPQEVALEEESLNRTHHQDVDLNAALDQKLRSQKVQKLLALLTPDYREVLYLYYLEEKSYEEIADIIRRPPGTVAALLSRAKKSFAELAARTGEIIHFTAL